MKDLRRFLNLFYPVNICLGGDLSIQGRKQLTNIFTPGLLSKLKSKGKLKISK